jgi:hypothetical protein
LKRASARLPFEDEMKSCLCRTGAAATVPSGPRPASPPGHSVARWLFGIVDVATGEGFYHVFPHATSPEFLRHLDDLLQLFRPTG